MLPTHPCLALYDIHKREAIYRNLRRIFCIYDWVTYFPLMARDVLLYTVSGRVYRDNDVDGYGWGVTL